MRGFKLLRDYINEHDGFDGKESTSKILTKHKQLGNLEGIGAVTIEFMADWWVKHKNANWNQDEEISELLTSHAYKQQQEKVRQNKLNKLNKLNKNQSQNKKRRKSSSSESSSSSYRRRKRKRRKRRRKKRSRRKSKKKGQITTSKKRKKHESSSTSSSSSSSSSSSLMMIVNTNNKLLPKKTKMEIFRNGSLDECTGCARDKIAYSLVCLYKEYYQTNPERVTLKHAVPVAGVLFNNGNSYSQNIRISPTEYPFLESGVKFGDGVRKIIDNLVIDHVGSLMVKHEHVDLVSAYFISLQTAPTPVVNGSGNGSAAVVNGSQNSGSISNDIGPAFNGSVGNGSINNGNGSQINASNSNDEVGVATVCANGRHSIQCSPDSKFLFCAVCGFYSALN
eukprot:501139_1